MNDEWDPIVKFVIIAAAVYFLGHLILAVLVS